MTTASGKRSQTDVVGAIRSLNAFKDKLAEDEEILNIHVERCRKDDEAEAAQLARSQFQEERYESSID